MKARSAAEALKSGIASERAVALAGLVAVTALAWAYLAREAALTTGGAVADAAAGIWSPGSIVLTFVMWTVMMAGMMLPSAAPAILLYDTIARRNAERGVALAGVSVFAAGYLAAWTAFGLGATLLQLALRDARLLTVGLASANAWLTGGILTLAGIYQWLPIKHACLDKCRNPLELFVTRWRPGAPGAFVMGVEHGAFCVGCCWALMLLMFAAGVMNLAVVALIAGFVFVEKILPRGETTTRVAGVGLVAAGLALAFLG